MGRGILFQFYSIYKEDGDYYVFVFAFSHIVKTQILSALEDTYLSSSTYVLSRTEWQKMFTKSVQKCVLFSII